MSNTTERESVAPAVVADVMPAPANPASAAGRDEYGIFRNAAGRVFYKVHLPPSYRPGTPMPVLLALHGRTMSGFGRNSMEDLSRFSHIADTRGFIVIYPQGTPGSNATKLGLEVDLHARHHRRSQGHEMILEDLNLVALPPGRSGASVIPSISFAAAVNRRCWPASPTQ